MTVRASTTADNASIGTICASAIVCAKSVSAVCDMNVKHACVMNAKSVGCVSIAPRTDMSSTMANTTGTRDGKKDKSGAGAAIMCRRGKPRNRNEPE